MIRALRVRHRAAWLGLAGLVPAGIVAGLLVRPESPISSSLPGRIVGTDIAAVEALELAPLTATGGAADIELLVAVLGSAERRLVLRGATDIKHPDVLVYWSSDAPRDGELPDDARLLGQLAGVQVRSFGLEAVGDLRGHIVLYSLAHHELLGWTEISLSGQ